MTTDPKTLNVSVTRVVDAPVEQVWRAWHEPELVMQWWGPKVFTSPSAQMDFREGGTSLVSMRAPAEFGRQDMYSTWTYSKIVPTERIEYVHNFADKDGNKITPASIGLPADIPDNVRHVVTLTPVGDNKTELSVTEYGYSDQQTHDMSKAGLEECLDKVEGIFAQR